MTRSSRKSRKKREKYYWHPRGRKKDEIIYEVADLFFHTLMVLGYHDISMNDIYCELGKRFGKSGSRPHRDGR